LGFFLHIPFPPLDIFLRLPWRQQVLEALLHYDVIGFQTERDRINFLGVVDYLMSDWEVKRIKGRVLMKRKWRDSPSESPEFSKVVEVGVFPISIDFDHFVRRSGSREVDSRARWLKELMAGSLIMIGIDRLDYTKGLPERLEAFRLALHRHPDLRRRLTLVQVVVPSRTDVPEYRDLKAEIEQLVGEINGQFTIAGWVPIHYIFRSLPEDELYAYYRAAQIALVTPLKDGMNLVAKEYCACHLEDDGVLILSEFAGSAFQLGKDALLVNPYDLEGVAEAIYTAFTMSLDEKRRRMSRLRALIKRHDIFWWLHSYLKSALSPPEKAV
ncbi:MAG: trehalose-6-phosphate synthase, partial [bacterium]